MCSIIIMVRRGNSKENSKLETTHICCKQTDLRMCGRGSLSARVCGDSLSINSFVCLFVCILSQLKVFRPLNWTQECGWSPPSVKVLPVQSFSPKPSRRSRPALWLNRFGHKILGWLSVPFQILNNRCQCPEPWLMMTTSLQALLFPALIHLSVRNFIHF